MIKLNSEFYKGILFLRLEGNLDKTTISNFKEELENINFFINSCDVVLNLNKLEKIDNQGINCIVSCLSKKKRKNYLCNTQILKNIKRSKLNLFFKVVSDELNVLNILN